MGDDIDLQQRITASLCGAAGARSATEPGAPDPVGDMFAVAEAIAARGVLDLDDLRHLSDAGALGVRLVALDPDALPDWLTWISEPLANGTHLAPLSPVFVTRLVKPEAGT